MRTTVPTTAVAWILRRHGGRPIAGPRALRELRPCTPNMRFAPPVMPAVPLVLAPSQCRPHGVPRVAGTLPSSQPVGRPAGTLSPEWPDRPTPTHRLLELVGLGAVQPGGGDAERA